MKRSGALAIATLLAACGGARGTEETLAEQPAGDEAPPPAQLAGAAAEARRPSAGMVELRVFRVDQRPLSGVLVLLQEKRDRGRIVPMVVGPAEGHAISLRLDRQKFTRPLTHDLLETVLERYGVQVLKLEIDDLKSGVFLGRLFLVDRAGEVTRLDTRPSDGIALALGAEAPIFIHERVVESTGEAPQDWDAPVPFGSPDPPRDESGMQGIGAVKK